MTGIGILLAVAGLGVTTMVIIAMILVTPSGGVDVHVEGTDGHGQGSDLSPVRAPDGRRPVPAGTGPRA